MEAKNEEIENKYIVRVVCQNKSRFIPFKEEELDTKKFPEKGELMGNMQWLLFNILYFVSVANIFGLKFGADVFSGFVLKDYLGFVIRKNLLADIIKNFHNGSMFYINVEYQMSDSCRGQIELVTPMVSFRLIINTLFLIFIFTFIYRCWKTIFAVRTRAIFWSAKMKSNWPIRSVNKW